MWQPGKEGRPVKSPVFRPGDAIYYHNQATKGTLPGRVLEAKPWRVKVIVSTNEGGKAMWVKPKSLTLREEA